MTSPRRPAAVVAGLVLGATAVLPCASAARADDGDIVFCLGHNRSRLVDTAVMLGLADRAAAPVGAVLPKSRRSGPTSTKPVTLEDWRREYGSDFDRACQALISTVQLEKSGRAPGPSPLSTMLTLLLPLLAGSLLTWLIGVQMAVFNGRQALAASLQASKRLLRNEAEALVAALSSTRADLVPSTDRLWRARADLVTHLEQVMVRHHLWTVPREVATALYDRSFMASFAPARFGGGKEERDKATKEVGEKINALTSDVESVALALQQPFRRHSEMGGP